MTRMYRMLTMSGLAVLLPCAVASADEIQDLKKEVQELRKEVEALGKDIKQVLQDLKTVKTAQAAPRGKNQPPAADTKIYDVSIGDSPVLGPRNAPVTIVEFSDFQCPFCVREVPVLKQLLKEYPNDVKVVYKHFPLSFHKQAKPASAAAVFAMKEKGNDAFWQMHDLIVDGGTKKLGIDDLRGYAQQMNLDLAKFDALMADEASQDSLLAADLVEARKCGVRGTPTILVNGLKQSPRTLDAYKARIDELLKEKKAN